MIDDRPECAECGGRHWLLEACAAGASRDLSNNSGRVFGQLASTATVEEIEAALAFHRRAKQRERDKQRRRRARQEQGVVGSAP